MARKCDKGKGAGRDKAEKAKGHAAGVALFAGEGEARIIERCSMESPDAEKQKPSHWLGFLNDGARTRNRTKDTGIFNPIAGKLNFLPLCYRDVNNR
ncbi:hypothetical protein CYR40_18910 [Chimaeribacter arupi]|uniref:hypothetical protein n=1 Tax=Chimaeribacter arupi TaxID=2060066 RepID=UPI000C7DBBFB|nr:hypothetical protein [Chimaeribacter arupi]PLR42956.1 hypothetical protein CYR40_18910 [Chimaeribacter arupi]